MDMLGSEKAFGKFQRMSQYGHEGNKTARLQFQPAFEFKHYDMPQTAGESNSVRNIIDTYKTLAR